MVYFFLSDFRKEFRLFFFIISKVRLVFRRDFKQRRFRNEYFAFFDQRGGEPVQHRQHQGPNVEPVHVRIGTDDDFVPAQLAFRSNEDRSLLAFDLHFHAAAQHLEQVGDDIVFENFVVIGFQAVKNFAAHRA